MSIARIGIRRAVLALTVTFMFFASRPVRADNEGLAIPTGPSIGEQLAQSKAVRNAAPVPGEEVTILRSFKIRKGSYPEFHRRSAEEIWPYFEKIGARIIGMWRVDGTAIASDSDVDYDEAILLTRYASLEHWRASRSPFDLGGTGPDAAALAAAHAFRQSVTLETSFKVLRGHPADNGPYFMPAVSD